MRFWHYDYQYSSKSQYNDIRFINNINKTRVLDIDIASKSKSDVMDEKESKAEFVIKYRA